MVLVTVAVRRNPPELLEEPFVPSSEDDGAAEPAAKSATEPQAEVASKPTPQPAKAPAHAKPKPLVTADADADAVIAALSAAGATDVEVGEPDKHPVQKPKPAHAAAPEVQRFKKAAAAAVSAARQPA